MSFDTQGMDIEGTGGIGGAGQDKKGVDSLTMQDQELIDIVTKNSTGDASQIIEESLGKNTAVGTLEGLKNKVDSIGRSDLKTSIDKVIRNITDTAQPIKDSIHNKAGGTPPAQQVDPLKNIHQADRHNVKGTLGSTLV